MFKLQWSKRRGIIHRKNLIETSFSAITIACGESPNDETHPKERETA